MPKGWTRVLALAVATGMAVPAAAEIVTGLDPQGDNFLSLRTGPGTGHREILRLGPGTHLTVIGSDGRWRRVRLDDGTEGWAFGAYLAPDPVPPAATAAGPGLPVGAAAVVAGLSDPDSRLSLRAGPSRSAERLASLPPGTALLVLGQEAEWVRVLTEAGQIGWVHGDYLAPAATAAAAGPAALNWARWENARFGMAIDYPAALFRPEPAPENGDGQSFTTADGRAAFFVFGQWNALDLSLAELRDMDLSTGVFGRVTENRLEPGAFTLAGVNAGQVTFRRALLPPPGDVLYVFEIGYPEVEADLFAGLAARMAQSFALTGARAGAAPALPGNPAADDPIARLLAEELRALAGRLP